jgi:hypothetical protein
MDLPPGEVDLDPAEKIPDVPWINEPLEGDDPDEFKPDADTCFLCERGDEITNPTIAKINKCLGMRGEISDSQRFMTAGTLQTKLYPDGTIQPIECARAMFAHEKRHILDTADINAENLQTLRVVARNIRKRLQRRREGSETGEVDMKQLDSYMKIVRLQAELLRCKTEGLTFTKNKRQRV